MLLTTLILAMTAVNDDDRGILADSASSKAPVFSAPIRLEGGEKLVKVEAPGYACPAWADIDEDGDKDLLVGQFAGGKIKVFRNTGEGTLDKGEWLKADNQIASVPGVW